LNFLFFLQISFWLEMFYVSLFLLMTRNVLRFFISLWLEMFYVSLFRCQFFLVQSLNCTFDGRNLENRKRYFLQD
jgi:hypothetical protein